MNDTPQHIKDLQLKIWLAKSPGERLRQYLLDNESLFLFWKAAKAQMDVKKQAMVPSKGN